jgi:hypothetical protein
MKCADCKHWNTGRVYDGGIFNGERKDPVCELIAARFLCTDDDTAEVTTPPDFGCVLWEAKKST